MYYSYNKNVLIFLLLTTFNCIMEQVSAQRGFYAGARPSGYYDKYIPLSDVDLSNRFDDQRVVNTDNGRIPVNAYNDIGLVNRLASLPTDKQPFWFLNYKQLEAQRRQPFPPTGQTVNSVQLSNRSPFAGSSTSSRIGASNNRSPINTSNRFGLSETPILNSGSIYSYNGATENQRTYSALPVVEGIQISNTIKRF